MEKMEDLQEFLTERGIETALAEVDRLNEINNRLMRERDNAIIKLQHYLESGTRIETSTSSSDNLLFTRYSLNDIRSATGDFSENLKVGNGEYGVVYKAEIVKIVIAVKVRGEDSFTRHLQMFHQQMDVLRDVRHPHLIRVVGQCLERGCIVYEYMVNGSLADRLSCKNGSPPLLWHVRVRIASEVCSALQFLHSLKPNGILHCSLKPQNILLDEFYSSKISDMGVARLLPQYSLLRGNISYIDPEYIRTGQFTEKSDVYSLGIIILQLLTGQQTVGLVNKVQQGVESGELKGLVDPLVGEWPIEQALQLANIALRCTSASGEDRPIIHPTLAQLHATASTLVQPPQEAQVPSLFTCPISQELMVDPHVVLDGFTCELEPIREWFDFGHHNSPMTNIRLPHTYLVPNCSLKSAIQEWKQAETFEISRLEAKNS